MQTIDLIRKYKWHLSAASAISVAAFAFALLRVQGERVDELQLKFTYLAGFIAMATWLPLHYLIWFGRPNHPALIRVFKTVYWLGVSLVAFFWIRVLFHFLSR